jgi:hypothetical protein
MRRLVLVLLLAAGSASAQESWVPQGTADLVLLDKIRAQPSQVAVKVGDSTVFGSITVKVTHCVIRPPDQPADAAAYVEVTDNRQGGGDVFHGWLLAKEPGVSQMEHPVYDLRLMGCH